MYKIYSKSDFETGASLVVSIPEAELDKKTLYTILDDKPEFLLPFRHRSVDGQIEFTYQIGNRSKITFLSGEKSPGEYVDLWFGVLQPLVDCWDWFLNPYSFVLAADHLYYDKNNKSISYIYIPSIKACSDYNVLKNMVLEVVKHNKVNELNLQNDILWAIQDFKPGEFLQMLSKHKAGVSQTGEQSPTPQPVQQQPTQAQAPIPPAQQQQPTPMPKTQPAPAKAAPEPSKQKPPTPQAPPAPTPVMQAPQVAPQVAPQPSDGQSSYAMPDDISINFGGGAQKESKVKQKKEKPPKPVKKEKSGLFKKKKPVEQEIMEGAAAMPNVAPQPSVQQYASPQNEYVPSPSPPPPVYESGDADANTELEIIEKDGPKLRYIGSKEHPRIIEVNIAENGIFTIGRFDASVGTTQSSFEFDKKTKAVSRRHAAIEHKADGHYLVDLDSAAGTFMDGRKLPPNASFKLNIGSRISFGYSGADYMWEE